jgi:hypothetical protein
MEVPNERIFRLVCVESVACDPSVETRPWTSKADFDDYCSDPKIADLHSHRKKGARDYIWHLFDKLEDLRPIFK